MDGHSGFRHEPDTLSRSSSLLELQRLAIAGDLHDELGSLFTQLGWALADLEGEPLPDSARQRLARVRTLVGETEAATRRVVSQLAPPDLMRLGLADALRRVARNVLTPRGIACQVDVSESAADLPEEHAITFYRAAQEAMTNVARHAGARQVSVAIAVEGGIARLEVVDDGRGSQTTGPDGAGLRLMRERVAGIGGRLSVEMLPTGRRVVVWAPVCRD